MLALLTPTFVLLAYQTKLSRALSNSFTMPGKLFNCVNDELSISFLDDA